MEIRTFDGDAAEAARFIRHVWRARYANRLEIPFWDEHCLSWQLLDEELPRDYLVAAYDGSRLVGTIFAEPFKFVTSEEFSGSISSWTSIDPQYSGRGIAKRLVNEHRRRMQERNARLLLGYGISGGDGLPFWSQFAETSVPMSVRLWSYILNGAAVSRAELDPLRRVAVPVAAYIQRQVKKQLTPNIRPYRVNDFDDCAQVLASSLKACTLNCIWRPDRLKRQLEHKGFPRTLVLESEGRVRGFINYYRLNFFGRSEVRTAIIDFVVSEGDSVRQQVSLIRAALIEMSKDDIHVAVTSSFSGARKSSLFSSGFIPIPGPYSVICFCPMPVPGLSRVSGMRILIR